MGSISFCARQIWLRDSSSWECSSFVARCCVYKNAERQRFRGGFYTRTVKTAMEFWKAIWSSLWRLKILDTWRKMTSARMRKAPTTGIRVCLPGVLIAWYSTHYGNIRSSTTERFLIAMLHCRSNSYSTIRNLLNENHVRQPPQFEMWMVVFCLP